MRFWRSRLPRALLPVCMALLLFVTLLPNGVAYAGSDDDKNGAVELSLYQRASELSREFGTMLAPGSGKNLNLIKDQKGKYVSPGTAGGLIGYADISSDDNALVGWLTNSFTAASNTITYDQLGHIVSGLKPKDSPFYQYAGYGEALHMMGLAKTIRANGMDNLGRLVTFLMILVYLLTSVAPFLLKVGVMILNLLNPFKLFAGAVNGMSNMDAGILSSTAKYVGNVYKAIQDLSILVLFPMLLVLTVLGALMLKKGNALQRFSRYGLRVFMLFAGLPLIGATYTGVIEKLDHNTAAGADYANYLIYSSYVDFEDWARNTRLAPPSQDVGKIYNPLTFDVSSYKVDGMRVANRSMILAINAQGANDTVAQRLNEQYGSDNLSKAIEKGQKTEANVSSDSKWGDTSSSGTTANYAFKATMDLLMRHAGADTYSGSQYDGEVAGQIQGIRNSKNEADIVKMYAITANKNQLAEDSLGDDLKDEDWAKDTVDWQKAQGIFSFSGVKDDGKDTDGFQFSHFKYNIYNAGGLVVKNGAYTTSVDIAPNKDGAIPPIGNSKKAVGGLSPLAMYNFLNTTFTDTGLTVFSPAKSSSDTTRDAYASVAFGSSGAIAVIRWLEDFVVMFIMGLVSIAFGTTLISVAVKGLPRILTSVFGTALGSIQFTTKLLISTAVMIVEALGIMFLYYLAEHIIVSILMGFDNFTTEISNYFSSTGTLLEFVRSFMVIAVVSIVGIFMTKNMKTFREMLEEVVSNAINRVMGVLDTSTGGKGLDITKTTGGRIGGNGRLTEQAKADDKNGKGLIGGVKDVIKAANDLESRRELLDAHNHAGEAGYKGRSLGERAKARAAMAKQLGKAKLADGTLNALSGGSVDGSAFDRALDMEKRGLDAMRYDRASSLGDHLNQNFAADADSADLDTTSKGQVLDENGNIIQDENGNAFDVNGNPISSAAPLAMTGLKAATSKDGALLDENGSAFTDEDGNVFYQDEKGKLVDENQNYVALDKDGVLKPISELGVNPVSATKEAKKLEGMRFDADKYAEMQKEQGVTHYGLDQNGTPVDAKGEPLQAVGKHGLVEPVHLDKDGFVTDEDGNRVQANAIMGKVDPRGFEKVRDPETGETYLRHKGDDAMRINVDRSDRGDKSYYGLDKNGNAVDAKGKPLQVKGKNGRLEPVKLDKDGFVTDAKGNRVNASQVVGKVDPRGFERVRDPETGAMHLRHKGNDALRTNATGKAQSLTALAKQANKAHASAARADEHVEQLKASGASPYVIQQSERYAAQMKRQAQTAQERFENAMQNSTKGSGVRVEPVSQDHVKSAMRYAASQKSALTESVNQLNDMKQKGAPPAEVTRQAQKVETQRKRALQAASLASDAKLAHQTGRSFNEVRTARERVNRAESSFMKAQSAYDQAVETKQPPQVVAKRKQELNRASQRLSHSQANLARVSQPSQGSREQIDRVSATFERAQAKFHQAQAKVEQLIESGAPQAKVRAAKKEQVKASRAMQKAQNMKQKLLQPANWSANHTVPQVVKTPDTSPAKSYATLASQGITTYRDYSQKVQASSQALRENQSKLQQAQGRLATLKQGNRPPQIVKQAEEQVQALKRTVQASQNNLNTLRDNAHGLLKNGKFKPVIANRPIRENGGVIVNQLVNMSHTQQLYDKLMQQEQNGLLPEKDKTRIKQLETKLGKMKHELIQSGIKEEALQNHDSIVQSARHMQQSWDAFVDGKSIEHED